MVMMLPNYMQIWGLAYNAGLCVKTFNLDEACGWKPDLEQLRQAVTNRTKLIAICNPNNPTGYILSAAEMDAIVAAADRVGAWILADEVYSGAERMADVQTPSFWGRYDKVLAINSLSKAYGLPGLRIGWVVCPAGTAGEVWRRHEYTTISATMLANKLATLALTPTTRIRLIQRTRACVRQGYALLDAWINTHDGILDVVPPQAAAIAFVRYHLPINSTALVERLRKEKSVLVVPGDHFGLDHHLRISFGPPSAYLQAGLGRIHELITNLASG
jgi:aspartate/methionine/tyrosine aminotransferase